jgi:hypothetical protein
LLKPEEEEIEETARETAAALLARVDKKQAAINPKTLPQQPGQAQYIKYTPADGGPQHASGAQSRIIKMQDMPVDPLEPPKFRHIKVGGWWCVGGSGGEGDCGVESGEWFGAEGVEGDSCVVLHGGFHAAA